VSRYPPPGALGPRLIARWALATQTSTVVVTGGEHVPADGPVLIAAHHYHHLLDGAVLIERLARPVHIVVALDWAADTRQRWLMERACALAQWPVVLRPASLAASRAYAPGELARYVRRGLRDAAALLRDGRVVVVFPEGYPVVDPASGTSARPPRDADGFLPFAGGFRTIGSFARHAGAGDVPIVPLGFAYAHDGRRWQITARFGAALPATAAADDVERAVRALSGPSANGVSPHPTG
jgi:1-acyl-sn-glycerol-3-phosphate acyltransferase